MDPLDHEVAGLRCRDVLAELSEFIDGTLPDERKQQILAHLKDCDRCERFGGEVAGVVAALRRELGVPRPAPERAFRSALDRLRDAMK